MSFTVKFTHQAAKDLERLQKDQNKRLLVKALELLEALEKNPWCNPPRYEKLGGSLKGAISRRLNDQHRLVYRVLENESVVLIISAWTHYE